MPGPIVNMGGTVTCMHGGQGQCTTVSPKVMVGSQPVVTIPASYVIAGCAFPPPPVANGPCISGIIPVGSTRVLASGMPRSQLAGLLLSTGMPMMIGSAGQTKVMAQ